MIKKQNKIKYGVASSETPTSTRAYVGKKQFSRYALNIAHFK